MSWAARISHTPDGLRLTFSEPLKQLDMDATVARRLASLLLVAAEEAEPRRLARLACLNGDDNGQGTGKREGRQG